MSDSPLKVDLKKSGWWIQDVLYATVLETPRRGLPRASSSSTWIFYTCVDASKTYERPFLRFARNKRRVMGTRISGMFWFAVFTWGGIVMFVVMGREIYVTSPLGTVIGLSETSASGKSYVAFRGIPYAKPPTGRRRFVVCPPFLSLVLYSRARQWTGKIYPSKRNSIPHFHQSYWINIFNIS